jgi:hypothetical protein
MNLNLNANFLFASLIWGAVGMGFFVYGKKQRALIPLYGGILMVGLSYIISSALFMSAACIGLIVFMYILHRNGY